MALPGGSIGLLTIDLDLDPSRYTRSQQTLFKEAQQASGILEKNFKNLGITSDAVFNLMKSQAIKSYEAIVEASKTNTKIIASDLIRVEEAKNAKLKELNEQQFGHQKTLEEQLIASYKELGVRSSSEFDQMRASIQNSYDLIANSGKATAEDLIRAEEAKNAKIKELNEQQFGHQKTLEDRLSESYKSLNIRSSAEFDQMRANIVANYALIAQHAQGDDLIRAEEAKNAKLKELNEQQFGHQKTLLEELRSSWLEFAAGIYVVEKAYRALKRIYNEIAEISKLGIKQEQAEKSLETIMKANDRYSQSLYKSYLDQASALQKLTGIRDIEIQKGIKLLQIYGDITDDMMPRTIKVMLNLATLMDRDVSRAAIELGKVSEGMVEGLRRMGIVIDKNIVKEKGFAGVLDEIEPKIRDHAESLAKGSGQWYVLRSQMEESNEKLGTVFNKIAEGTGIIKVMTLATEGLIYALNKLLEIGKNKNKENRFGVTPTTWAFESVVRNVAKQNANKNVDLLLQELYGMNILDLYNYISKLQEINRLFDPEKSPLSPAYIKSRQEMSAYMKDLTSTEEQKKIDEITAKFEKFKITMGDTPELTEQLAIALAKVREEFNKIKDKPDDSGKEIKSKLKDIIDAAEASNKYLADEEKKRQEDAETYFGIIKRLHEWKEKDLEAEEKKRQEDAKTFFQIIDNLHKQEEEAKKTAAANIETWYGMASQMQKDFSSSISGALLNGENLFESFFKKVGAMWVNLIADMASKQIFQPVLDKVWSGTYGASGVGGLFNYQLWGNQNNYSNDPNFVGPVKPGGTTVGNVAGGAAIGYGMGGTGGMIGGAIGSFFSPAGTIVGSVLGTMVEMIISKASEDEPELPNVATVWQVVGDHVELIRSSWDNISTQEADKIISDYRKALEGQSKFFANLYNVIGMPGASAGTLGFGNIVGQQAGASYIFERILRGYPKISKLFENTDVLDPLKSIYEQMLGAKYVAGKKGSGGSGGYAGYGSTVAPSWEAIITHSNPYQFLMEYLGYKIPKEFTDWYDVNAGINDPNYDWDKRKIIKRNFWQEKGITPEVMFQQMAGVGGSSLTDLYDKMQETLGPFQEGISSMVGKGFLASLETGEYQSFKDQLNLDLGESIKNSITSMFSSRITGDLTDILMPGFNLAGKYVSQQMAGGKEALAEDETEVLLSDVSSGFKESIMTLNDTMKIYEPIYAEFSTLLSELNNTLGQNVDAIIRNTEAILGPVNSYLEKLMGMDTGPTSTAFFASQQEKYWTSAFADPEKFSEYANFMTGGALDFIKQTSIDWSTWVSSEKTKVENVPWIIQANNQAGGHISMPTAKEIGDAVATSIIAQSSNQPRTIQLIVGSKVVEEIVYTGLDNTDVQQKLRSIR